MILTKIDKYTITLHLLGSMGIILPMCIYFHQFDKQSDFEQNRWVYNYIAYIGFNRYNLTQNLDELIKSILPMCIYFIQLDKQSDFEQNRYIYNTLHLLGSMGGIILHRILIN